MRSNKFAYVLLVTAVLFVAVPALAQDNTFSNPNVNYSFALPDAKWKMTAPPSATNLNVEYVFGDRFDGHLEVRKLSVAKDDLLTDIVQDEEQRLRFRQGFVSGRTENFLGRIKGEIFNFEYVAGGRNMSGRFYFLRAADTTVYVLRFTGQKDSLRSIRHQADSIARTFAVKQ